ncbi:MAG TPA: quinone oxidoreductase [Gaiellaceae bacterium]|nr:quinone oxidoreductase [Gaiellaceae bacterium]
MRAIVVTRSGGPDVLELQDVAPPVPGPGELLVDVAVAGVNFRDVYERRGGYGVPLPVVTGIEGMGRVAALGEGVSGVAVGDRVAWSNAQGSYAEQAVVQAARAVPVPDGIDDEHACAALLQGMTAHYLTHSTYPVQPGDEVLVHAAAGGAGRLTVQMAKARGARVTATTSGGEKAELARSAGADEVIGYDEVPEGRFAVVYDGVGAATFDRSLAALAPRGMLVLYGAASGPVPPFEIMRLNAGSTFLTRPTLVHYVATREDLLQRAGDVYGRVADGSLDVRIGATYPLEEARRAQEDLESRGTTGKLLLTLR